MKKDALTFEVLQEKDLYNARIFQLQALTCRNPEGRVSDFYKLHTGNWANIIAQTPNESGENCFVMVRQYRHGSRQLVWEFPGGMVDEGEDALKAALRELEEETGYRAESAQLLGVCNPNPAFMDNLSYTFFTQDIRFLGQQKWDENEFIEVALIPVTQVLSQMGSGDFANGVMAMATFFYYQKKHLGSGEVPHEG